MNVPIYIVIRRSYDLYFNLKPNLSNIAANQYHIAGINRAMQWWPRLFNNSWPETRRQISDIVARYNILSRPDAIYFQSDIELPKQGWVIPLDDDDLIDPRVISKLRKINTKIEACRWPVTVLSDCTKLINNTDASNSYAIKSELITEDKRLLYRHVYATANADFKIISNKPLGLKITHPASIGMLKLFKTEQDLMTAVKQFKDYNYTGLYKDVVKSIQDCF